MRKPAFLPAFLLSACLAVSTPEATSTPGTPLVIMVEQNPYAPKPRDDRLDRTGIILTSINLTERTDLDPARVEIDFLGSMPGVCNELRMQINPPDEEYRIYIETYSAADPNIKCENVFQQFEASILLGIYSPGRYSVWVNDEFVGDFISY